MRVIPLAVAVVCVVLAGGCGAGPTPDADASNTDVEVAGVSSPESVSGAAVPIDANSSGLLPLAMDPRPYSRTPDNLLDLEDPDYLIDSRGSVLKPWPDVDGYVFHPVDLCWYILGALESYTATGDPAFLERATVNAQTLLDGAENVSGALWFPYSFDYVLHQTYDMPAPWYSGMAQGMALTVFTRMYEATDDRSWLEAAARVFASFDPSAGDERLFVETDESGNLWFEEYVGEGVPPIRVINGHMYAMWGLYDYAMATGDPTARGLFDAGATTIEESFDQWRVPGGYSYYCASETCWETAWQPSNYHRGVIRQLQDLALMTGHRPFLTMADTLKADGVSAGASAQ